VAISFRPLGFNFWLLKIRNVYFDYIWISLRLALELLISHITLHDTSLFYKLIVIKRGAILVIDVNHVDRYE
jgi:hypothetical protein